MRPLLLLAALTASACGVGQPLGLSDAVRAAERSRDSIKAAELRVRAAELSLGAATPFSPLRLETGYGTFPTLGAGEDLLVALPIDLFGKNAAARGNAAAALATARAQLRQTKLDLQTEVMNAYAELLSAQIQKRTGQAMLDLQQRSYDATKKRVDTGDLPPVELMRADLELQRAKEAASVQAQALIAARQRFAAVIGRPVEEDVEESLPVFPPGAQTKRPDIQELKAAVQTANAEVRSSDRDRLPDFEVQFRRSPWGDPEQYNGRVQLVWNLLDWGAGSKKSRAARATRAAAEHDLLDRQAFAIREVEAARADVAAAQASVETFNRLEDQAQKLVATEQSGYELGGNTLLGVLEATRALREIEASAADAKLRLLQAEAKLLGAQGILLTESK